MIVPSARHAYLIAAHGGLAQLKALLFLLDDERNDIYLHIDKSAGSVCAEDFSAIVKRSSLRLIRRRRSPWGSPVFIDVMLALLQAAAEGEHQYYHLLSGVDLPLKSQSEIHAFFQEHVGEEFLNYQHPVVDSDTLHHRLGLYHLPYKKGDALPNLLNRASEKLQTLLRVDRLRHCPFIFQKGHLWFSITHGFAAYVLEQAPKYRPWFRLSVCGDELFFHTIMVNSPFDKYRYMPEAYDNPLAIQRYIDWERSDGSSPYTYTMEDYEALAAAPHLFARKFDAERDPELFEKMVARLYGK